MKESEERLRKRLTGVLNKHLGWRLKLRWFFFPKRKKLCIDILVNSAKYMNCHKDEIENIGKQECSPIDILMKTLPSYTFVQEENRK